MASHYEECRRKFQLQIDIISFCVNVYYILGHGNHYKKMEIKCILLNCTYCRRKISLRKTTTRSSTLLLNPKLYFSALQMKS